MRVYSFLAKCAWNSSVAPLAAVTASEPSQPVIANATTAPIVTHEHPAWANWTMRANVAQIQARTVGPAGELPGTNRAYLVISAFELMLYPSITALPSLTR